MQSATEPAEREAISRALADAGGNRTAAARMLNIPRSTLYYRISRLGRPGKGGDGD